MNTPKIVISLDFECRWGVADKLPADAQAYRRNLEGETEAVHGMLEYFGRAGVGATWAAVGALACSGWDEYHVRAPGGLDRGGRRLSFRPEWQALDPSGRLHFAPDSVVAIARAQDQELASHTFSHSYFREPGIGPDDILADSFAVASLFEERTGAAPTSFVFPRNQVAHTDVIKQAGIERWRTNPKTAYWNATSRAEQSRLVRGLRLADSIAPLGTRRAPASEYRASYFVRFSLPGGLWKLHLGRMIRDARRLQCGESLHLWWHPHNLGADVGGGLLRLDELVDRLRSAAPEGTRFTGMRQSADSR